MRITEADISVVIPVRNGTPVLARAFNSIRSISTQIEIVLVENGSSDTTFALCNQLADVNTQVHKSEVSGVSNARNMGIATAGGKVITLLDADDEMLKERIDYITSREWQETDFVIGTMKSVESESTNFPIEIVEAISKGLPMYAGIAVAFTKKGFIKTGGFDADLTHGEDLDLIMRAKSRGFQTIYTETPFLIRHFHTENVSLDRTALVSGMFSALRANIENSRSKKSSIKILHVMPNYFPHNGGIETLMSQYFELQADNHRFSHSIIALRREDDPSAQLTKGLDSIDEVSISRIEIKTSLIKFSLSVMKQLREIIRKRNPDLIHLHAIHELSIFTLKLAEDLGIPVIVHFHGSLLGNDYKLLKPVVPIMKYVLGVSEATKESLRDFLPNNVSVHMIPNGIKDYRNLPRLNQKSIEPLFVVAGRIESEKGFDLAIKAFALIKKDIGSAKLVVLGDGSQLENLSYLARALGIADSIEFIGSIPNEEVIKCIDESWIVLVPSRDIEGFGIIAIEAALREVPVVATAVGGLTETIEDGKSGFLVSPESPQAIANKVLELLSNSDQLPKIGAYARRRALELYGIEKFAAKLEEYYLEVYEREVKP